jgi:hypothetical protein
VLRAVSGASRAVWKWLGLVADIHGRLVVMLSACAIIGGGGLLLLRVYGVVNAAVFLVGIAAILLGLFLISALLPDSEQRSANDVTPHVPPEEPKPRSQTTFMEGKTDSPVAVVTGNAYQMIQPAIRARLKEMFLREAMSNSFDPVSQPEIGEIVWSFTDLSADDIHQARDAVLAHGSPRMKRLVEQFFQFADNFEAAHFQYQMSTSAQGKQEALVAMRNHAYSAHNQWKLVKKQLSAEGA